MATVTVGYSRTRFIAFEKKWLNKKCPAVGWSRTGGQCVDMVRQYMLEVLRIPRSKLFVAVPGSNAEDFFKNASTTYFKKVRNSPSLIPEDGWIAVFSHGVFGHVAVTRTKCTNHLIRSFDQNWSIPRRCSFEGHGYGEIIGFLVPKTLKVAA